MAVSLRTLQGGSRLVFDSVEGITTAVETMHETIARLPAPLSPRPEKPTAAHGAIAAAVYATIRGTNGTLREGADLLFKLLPQSKDTPRLPSAETRTIAAINGVFGDHLESTDNTLAIPMSLHANGEQLELNRESLTTAIPAASPNLVVLVHGLCLSEQCWRRNGTNSLGEKLHSEFAYTPLYLRYNTGRHISSNGQEFAQLLEQLVEAWPVPVETLSLIGHSMGGLVIRSAGWYANKQSNSWLGKLKRVVCLGSPHHGSMLERAGQKLDAALRKSPYLAPLAFTRHRSAGIKDLSHGDLIDADWQSHHPDQPQADRRHSVPLLPGVDYYFAAASIGKHSEDPLGVALGDLLVGLNSAVGSHKSEHKTLEVKPENCRVFHAKSHLDLLDDERVHHQVIDWFR